ncbi:hypothetical protein ACGFIX_05610 [Nocardia salmonicida]|uniref:hypothetical protein n=1 Tax=Nocardia salmonicida TaxID=53431 RepID=UPI0037191AA2
MSQPGVPAIIELEDVLIPETSDFYVNDRRHIVVALALFTETVTLYTVMVVGEIPSGPMSDHVKFSLRDERGVEYPMVGGGQSGGGGGESHDARSKFRRPDDHRPTALTVSWTLLKARVTKQTGDLFTVDVPSRG